MGNCLMIGDAKSNVNEEQIDEVEPNGENEEHIERYTKSLISASTSSSGTLRIFTLDELTEATSDFALDNMIGEGGFGKVHKGLIKDFNIAAKRLNAEGCQGSREWQTEVESLRKLHHPHLVQLIGVCFERDERILIYEYMPRGSLEDVLSNEECDELNWERRLRIVNGIAKGLAYLHNHQPPIIHRDLKPSNILIDSDYNAKLCDFGLARDGPTAATSHVSTRVMGTHAYVDPDYFETGKLRLESDVYGFGVVLLQILTGRKPMMPTRSGHMGTITGWARPWLRCKDRHRIREIMDPRLRDYPIESAIAAGQLADRCTGDLRLRYSADMIVGYLMTINDHEEHRR